MALENDDKFKRAVEFLKSLATASPEKLAEMMIADLGIEIADLLAGYAEAAASTARTVGQAAEVAKAMITIGYLLRAAEESDQPTAAAPVVLFPVPIDGTYKH